ncbi:MAG TPA: DUF2461 domain-containing protein [Acidisarcina sp.]
MNATKSVVSRGKAGVPPAKEPAKPYFTEEGMKFLRGLRRNNKREWFEPRKPIYEHEVKQPMLALIEAVTAAMESFAPAHVRPPQKCLMRIYRDTRFSADKTPYKKHVAAWWTRAGLEKTSGAGFYLHVGAAEVVVAAGSYMPERAQLFAIRSWLMEHHEEFRAMLDDKRLRHRMEVFDGLPLSRSPKGFPAEHPAADLFRCRQWGLSATLPGEVALGPSLVRNVVERFRLATPLVDALNAPLSAGAKAAQKPLFGLY